MAEGDRRCDANSPSCSTCCAANERRVSAASGRYRRERARSEGARAREARSRAQASRAARLRRRVLQRQRARRALLHVWQRKQFLWYSTLSTCSSSTGYTLPLHKEQSFAGGASHGMARDGRRIMKRSACLKTARAFRLRGMGARAGAA